MIDGALERCIAALTERFASLPVATVAETVYRVHAELEATSTIVDHLVPLTHRRAATELAMLVEAATPCPIPPRPTPTSVGSPKTS